MAIFLFFISFFIYLYTLYPTLPAFRDAGDLITSAYTLGIAHPPGYPVYVILGKLWTFLLPFGNIGYRLNLLSAFISSLCIVITYYIAKKVFSTTWPALVSAFFLIFSSSFWQQSIISEIYSLNALFAVLILYLLLLPILSHGRTYSGYLLLSAFLLGLALGNHHSIVLLIPGILYLIMKNKRKSLLPSFSLSFLLSLLSAFILGFSIYLFLPIRSAQQPINNWGNPKNLGNFANVITRADYGVIKLSRRHSGTVNALTDSVKMYWELQKKQLGWPGLILLLIGTILCFSDIFGKTLLLLFIFSGPFFIFLSRLPNTELSLAILEPACVLPMVFETLIIGSIIKKTKIKPLIYFFLGISLYAGFINLPKLNKRYDFLAYDYVKNLARSVPKNSFLSITADIPIFTINYLQTVEKKRQDIKVVLHSYLPWRIAEYENKYPELFSMGKSGSTTDCLLKIVEKYPVFAEGVHAELEEYSVPIGIICRISKDKNMLNRAKMIKTRLFLYDLYPFRKPPGNPTYYGTQVINYYVSSCHNSGVVFTQAGWQNEANASFNRRLMFNR